MDTFQAALWALNAVNGALLFYLISINALYLALMALSVLEMVRLRRTRALVDNEHLLQLEETPSISIISPAYNEAATIVDSLNALLGLRYPRCEVIVVNDGSKDSTLETLVRNFGLYRLDYFYHAGLSTRPVRNVYRSRRFPTLTVVDKENGGKADSLNAGINVARHELFCAIDADSLLEEDALLKGVYPFVRWRGKVAVTSGIIRVANGCTVDRGRIAKVELPSGALPLFQIVEYIRVFLLGRMAWNALNSVLIVSGAFGIFDKSLVLRAGGYRTDTVGEDMELVVRLHRKLRDWREPRRILFLPDPVCWTEAPETAGVLRRQRDRWQRGLMETLFIHRGMLFNPAYGAIGLFSMPFVALFEMLSPAVELFGYLSLSAGFIFGMVQIDTLVLFLAATLLFGLLQSVCGLLIEEILFHKYGRMKDLLTLILFSVLENFGYRQFNFAARLTGAFGFFARKKGWGAMTRTGFKAASP